jgi:hypothetical protein
MPFITGGRLVSFGLQEKTGQPSVPIYEYMSEPDMQIGSVIGQAIAEPPEPPPEELLAPSANPTGETSRRAIMNIPKFFVAFSIHTTFFQNFQTQIPFSRKHALCFPVFAAMVFA